MSTPIHAELTGSFTTNATPSPVTLNLPSSATEIEIINVTDYNAHAAAITKAKGYSSLASGAADVWTGSGANPNVMTLTQVLTGGFTFFSFSNANSLAQVGTRVTKAKLVSPDFQGIKQLVARR